MNGDIAESYFIQAQREMGKVSGVLITDKTAEQIGIEGLRFLGAQGIEFLVFMKDEKELYKVQNLRFMPVALNEELMKMLSSQGNLSAPLIFYRINSGRISSSAYDASSPHKE